MSKTKSGNTEETISDREVADLGHLELIREGRNTFIRNKLSVEEQQAHIKQIKENLPNLRLDIKALVSKVVSIINSYDKIFVLGGIASRSIDEARDIESDNSSTETLIEYCQSIAMASANTNQGKIPSKDVLQEIHSLLLQIKDYSVAYYNFESVSGKYSELQADLRRDMILEKIIVRGEGYLCHIIELFEEMFIPHDDFFEMHYGFKSKDIVETFRQLESSFTLRVASPNGGHHPFFEYCLRKWQRETEGNGKYPEEFAIAHPGVSIENGQLFLYPITWITYYDKLYKIRHFNSTQEKVVQALALRFGDNHVFGDTSKFPNDILTESYVQSKPIVEDSHGNHYLFGFNLGARNYFNIAYNLIKSKDLNYFNNSFLGNRTERTKDDFIERKVTQLFKKMLPEVKFERNVIYTFDETGVELKCAKSKDGRYELDIIGISDNATYLIEVKSGLVSEEAKRGAIESIKTDLSSIVGNAICQSYRAYRYLITNSDCQFLTPDKKIVKPINKENVFRISVSFSYVGTIITSLTKLQQFGVIDTNADFGWTVNIFDLFPFAELIESENQFIDYLQKRIPFYKNQKISGADEMDMLGFYLADDFKIDEAHANTTDLGINGYHSDIDEFFNLGGKKPVKENKK